MVYPVETTIYDADIIDLDDYALEEYTNNKVNVVSNYSNFGEWVCFNYALENDFIDDCQEGFLILSDEFEQIPFEEAKEGDLITYHDMFINDEFISEYNVHHFGILAFKADTINESRIESKWGTMSVYNSSIADVPQSYGNVVCFWRRKND